MHSPVPIPNPQEHTQDPAVSHTHTRTMEELGNASAHTCVDKRMEERNNSFINNRESLAHTMMEMVIETKKEMEAIAKALELLYSSSSLRSDK